MTEPWHKTETSAETAAFSADFWQRHRDAIESGEFWADKIKHLRGQPTERLRLAIENLPLPGAFREAAIATRALIRERRKLNEPYEDQLTLLYWLAAIDSFSIPYSEKLQTPGYNVVEAVPGSELKSLPFTYADLGYKKLGLLNKMDAKWLIETWSEPRAHSTLHVLHHDVWEKYERHVGGQLKERDEELANLIRASMDAGSTPQVVTQSSLPSPRPAKLTQRPMWQWIFVAVVFTIIVYSCSR